MPFGAALRQIRRDKDVTLQKLSDATSLSKSFLSQIEHGQANPSIASLKKITDALDVPLAALFEPVVSANGEQPPDDAAASRDAVASDAVRVVRRDRRKRISWPDSDAVTSLLVPDLQRKLEVILSDEPPGSTSGDEPYSHVGEEFGLVLEGRYEMTIDGETYVLEEGDSIYYPSHLPHRYKVLGDQPARTLWVVTPPSF
jgi:transcriptional regulator with XRE-family HTH domain